MKEPLISLMIAGAQKAGTTSLSHWLFRSSCLIGHDPDVELAYFINSQHYERGFQWALKTYYPTYVPGVPLFAKNVGIMGNEVALKRLRSHNPDCVVVLVLRNPVERAYSAYWFARQRGYETAETFELALKSEPRSDPSLLDWAGRARQYIRRGLYLEQIKQIEDLFPKRNILTFLTEDIEGSPEYIYRTIYESLGVYQAKVVLPQSRKNVAALPKSTLINQILSQKIPIPAIFRSASLVKYAMLMRQRLRAMNAIPFKPPQMHEETRMELAEIFKPWNEELGEYLGRDLSHWR